MSSLAKRVATAAALLPLVVLGVLWLPTSWFATGALLFVLAGAWEWSAMAGLQRPATRLLYVLATWLLAAACMGVAEQSWGRPLLLAAGVGWWLVALAWVVAYQQGRDPSPMRSRAVAALVGWLVLLPSWLGMVFVHASEEGPYLVLLLFVIIWSADTGAYFAGRRFGRRRLAARVSPGKTWEGLAGATLAVLLVAAVTNGESERTGLAWPYATALVVMLVSVLGDLTESLFKRRVGMKDSGTLLPGHGGVLDRIDSLTAAAPVFAAILWASGVLA